MREIKFRGKSFNQQWRFGSLLRVDGIPHIVSSYDAGVYGYHIEFFSNYYLRVGEETIGQFTGLCDKNGKEIYEGDILQFKRDRFISKPIAVVFHNGAFGYFYTGDFVPFVGNTNFKFYINGSDESFEVIGNIHDNPELLKKDKEL